MKFIRESPLGPIRHIVLEEGEAIAVLRFDARSMKVEGNEQIKGRSTIVYIEASDP